MVVKQSFALRDRGSNGRLEETANEELHNLCFSSDIAGVVGTGKMIWSGLMAHDGEKRNSHSLDQHVNNKFNIHRSVHRNIFL
jgi:hypothetical protein